MTKKVRQQNKQLILDKLEVLKMKPGALADKAGIDRGIVTNYLNRDGNPTIKNVEKMLEALNIKIK